MDGIVGGFGIPPPQVLLHLFPYGVSLPQDSEFAINWFPKGEGRDHLQQILNLLSLGVTKSPSSADCASESQAHRRHDSGDTFHR